MSTDTPGTDLQNRILTAQPLEGCDPIVGLGLWVMHDTRRRTLREIGDLPDEWLDRRPQVGHNTLGTILHHIASAEVGWLYDLMQEEPPGDVKELVQSEGWDEQGHLVSRGENALAHYLAQLELARSRFMERYKELSVEEYRRLREIPYWEGGTQRLTPERVLYHLVNHEAEHRGELTMIIQHFKEQAEG